MGYYGGSGGRLVWTSAELTGKTQPGCPLSKGVNMIACDNWTPSTTVRITENYPQGDYLFKLVGKPGEASWIPLTVWAPASKGTYLLKNDVQTWQAWNTYGGYDYYVGKGKCPRGVYPLCSRARVVSYDRPYGDFGGAGDFYILELPLVHWAEQQGLDLDYANDITLAEHPEFALNHKVILSLGHDECWDYAERMAAVAAYDHGVNLAFFGASGLLRHVRLESSPLGKNRQLVDYRDANADPLNVGSDPMAVTGNTWGSPPANWPEESFVGEAYNGFLNPNAPAAGLRVLNASAWIYAGTGLRNGQTVPGVIASDVDSLEPDTSHPDNVEVFAHSAANANKAQPNTREGNSFYSDMTYYTDPKSEAGVWDSGTNNWIADLAPCAAGEHCPSPVVRKITANLLRVLGSGPAGLLRPSSPNWRGLYPR